MRELLEDLENGPSNPMEAARRAMRPPLRARFYAHATVGEVGAGGFPVRLDGRPVRTPAGRTLAAPTVALAAALAEEWERQGTHIDPAAMPLTRLVNTVIDGVADAGAAVAEEIGKYLASDLLFYRAEGPAGLVAAQAALWDPVLAWAAEALGARFLLAEGVMFVAQPEPALAAVRAAIPAGAWQLAAVHALTTLTGSALLALALLKGQLSVEQAWGAAHADEDWNMAQWGRDPLALERRAFRFAEMRAAATVLALAPA